MYQAMHGALLHIRATWSGASAQRQSGDAVQSGIDDLHVLWCAGSVAKRSSAGPGKDGPAGQSRAPLWTCRVRSVVARQCGCACTCCRCQMRIPVCLGTILLGQRGRRCWVVCRAQQQATAAVEGENGAVATEEEDADVPTPVVKIDNQHDPFATVVTIEYGNRLGELLDTVRRSPLVSCMPSRHCMHGMCSHPAAGCTADSSFYAIN